MSGRVLIIEDDTRIANWVKVYFERAGFSADVTHDVELSLEVSGDLPEMVIDRMRMGQALGNVISNAIHCTEADGSIVLGAGLESDKMLAISITDDGIGIPATDLPHVFDRFYRTEESRSRGIGGTGLGLAIARAIVEAHGGTIAVASRGLGQGATVTFRLPLSNPASSSSATASTARTATKEAKEL